MEPHDPLAIARGFASSDYAPVATFNDSAFFVARPPDLGASDWERHADTDELLLVLAGSVTVEILTEADRRFVPLTAGQFTVVPRGHWHRHVDLRGLVELFYMPGSCEESTAEDPRFDGRRSEPVGPEAA